jgi:hypothetical protein
MKTIAVLALALVTAAAAFCADLGVPLPQARAEALLRVIAKPQDFVGKGIRVSGIFSWGFEDERLFLSADHFAMCDEASAIDLRLDEKRSGLKSADLVPYCGFRVKVEGIVVEEAPRQSDIELARRGGFTITPRYHLLFTRLISYGPATPNQALQHNAGSRPTSMSSPASETPSSLGPRG